MKLVDPYFDILTKINGEEILKFLEKCGRTCYKSEDKITEDSARKLIKAIIASGHEFVIEHFVITVKFICDIGFYKDITRHRMASFSVELTRYCNYSKGKFGGELTFIKPVNIELGTKEYEIWKKCMEDIENHYLDMAHLSATPDMLRMMLPHSTAASVICTANLREWRHILKLRSSKRAHPSIYTLMRNLLKEFQQKIPIIFDDIVLD